jgi:hypothetical protein
VSKRLNHGEWVPYQGDPAPFQLANFCPMAFLVVATLPSDNSSPWSPRTQYRLVLAPRSMPIVIGPSGRAAARFGLCDLILFFFMAGLLLHFECVSIGTLTHPAGGQPSHSISVTVLRRV